MVLRCMADGDQKSSTRETQNQLYKRVKEKKQKELSADITLNFSLQYP